MAHEHEELDDLLADTPTDAELQADEDSATAAATPVQQIDLDDLLAESVEQQKRAKQHRDDLKALRKRDSGLDEAERKRAAARVLEWEITHVWVTTARIHRFDVHTCTKCMSQHSIYTGEWLQQEHKALHCKRLVRLPSVHDIHALSDMVRFTLDKLPVYRLDFPREVDQCPQCCTAPMLPGKPLINFS